MKNKFLVAMVIAMALPPASFTSSVEAQNNNRQPGQTSWPQTSMPQTSWPGTAAPQQTQYGGYNQYGRYPYANQPGYGYYNANPGTPVYPAYGAPVPINGGGFRFNVGGFSGSYWRAPSGYYYPWGAGALYAQPAPIIVVEQGASQPAQPPIPDMLRDMSSYIEDQNTKKKFKPEDYTHLSRRARDLQTLESTMRTRNGGTLDIGDEEKLRKDCAMLSGDISRRIIP